jgi:hypothetical protein
MILKVKDNAYQPLHVQLSHVEIRRQMLKKKAALMIPYLHAGSTKNVHEITPTYSPLLTMASLLSITMMRRLLIE